jgi:hypothetical protein
LEHEPAIRGDKSDPPGRVMGWMHPDGICMPRRWLGWA